MKCQPDLSLTGWPQGASGISGPLPDLAHDVLLPAFMPEPHFADLAATIPAGVDDAVARVKDMSGAGNHAIQATVASRPHRRTGGGLNWLGFDGVDDRLAIPPDVSWNKSAMSIVVVMRALASGQMVLFGNADSTGTEFAAAFSGTGQSNADASAGSAAYYANGNLLGSGLTRGELGDEWKTGDWVEAAGVNAGASLFVSQGAQILGFRETLSLLPADIGFTCLIPTASLDTGPNRADLVAALAAKFGITP